MNITIVDYSSGNISSVINSFKEVAKDKVNIKVTSDINKINSPMLLKETLLVRNALNEDLFRYDASELMERRIGADYLLLALREYISYGNLYINLITQELDSQY